MIKKRILSVSVPFAMTALVTLFSVVANAETIVTIGEGGSYADFNGLMSAVASGAQDLDSGDIVQLSGDLNVTSNTVIPSGYDLKLDLNGKKITSTGFAGRAFTIASGAKLEVYGNGEIYSDAWGAFDIYGELDVRDGYYSAEGWYETASGSGAVFRSRPSSKLVLMDDVKVYSKCGGALYAEGDLNVGACQLISDSHNGLKGAFNENLWTYCAQCIGTGVFTGTNIQGVQGGLYVGGEATINGGIYTAADLTDGSYTGHKAFYGLYISDGAKVTINDGVFNAGDYDYCILNGDNDVEMDLGNPIVINGGTFNGKVGSQDESGVLGYTINGGRFSDIASKGTGSLLDCAPSGYEFVKDGEYYVLQQKAAESLGEASLFNRVSGEEKVAAGYYFDFEKELTSTVKKADVRFVSETENKELEKTLILPTLTGGAVKISILILDAPADVKGTIELK